MATRRILVTGGAGFIGSHLVRRLCLEGHRIHVLRRPGGGIERISDLGSRVQFWDCDLIDAACLAAVLGKVQPEIIYHLAGDTSVRHVDPTLAGVTRSIERNVTTSLNLFVATQAHCRELELLVRTGGLEEYGRGAVPFDEGQREDPVSPYSASQVAVTHYLKMMAPYLSFRAVTVRPALVYGPGQSRQFLIPSLIDHCLRGIDFRMMAGSSSRDLLYVDDLVEALCLTCEKPLPGGEIINIGVGREYRMSDVAATILRLTGSRIQLVQAADFRPSEIEHLYCSTGKAVDLLDWRPQVDLEEGLERTIAWCRQL